MFYDSFPLFKVHSFNIATMATTTLTLEVIVLFSKLILVHKMSTIITNATIYQTKRYLIYYGMKHRKEDFNW